jgi:hypothetical protein
LETPESAICSPESVEHINTFRAAWGADFSRIQKNRGRSRPVRPNRAEWRRRAVAGCEKSRKNESGIVILRFQALFDREFARKQIARNERVISSVTAS